MFTLSHNGLIVAMAAEYQIRNGEKKTGPDQITFMYWKWHVMWKIYLIPWLKCVWERIDWHSINKYTKVPTCYSKIAAFLLSSILTVCAHSQRRVTRPMCCCLVDSRSYYKLDALLYRIVFSLASDLDLNIQNMIIRWPQLHVDIFL